MKKFTIILLILSLSLCIGACGDKEDNPTPISDNALEGYEGPFPEEHAAAGEEVPEEEDVQVVLPPPPGDADFYRGTWISGGEGNINDTLDHYYDSPYNYMTLSPDGSGALVLGGQYMELLYTVDGSTVKFTLSQTGERFIGSVLSEDITEINYMNTGNLMTFIKIKPDDMERVKENLGLWE